MIVAVLDANNVIVNVVVSGEGWTAPEGTTARDITDLDGGIGWTWPPGANAPVNPNPPVDLVPVVPATATAGDFLRALIELGWYGDVAAVIDAQDPNTEQGLLLSVLWNRAAIFERNNSLVIMVATAIGKTSDDLDELFLKTLTYL